MLAIAFPKLYSLFMCYIAIPLRGWGEGFPAEPPFVEADIAAMPPHAAAAFVRAARQLVPLGFTATANLRAPAHLPGTDGYVSLWLCPRDGTSVQLIALHITAGGGDLPPRDVEVVTFVTDFAGGGGVTTSNSLEVSVFAPHPAWDGLRWPGMNDLAALYRLHAFRADRAAGAVSAGTPQRSRTLPQQPIHYLRQQNVEGLQWQVKAGYMCFDAGSNVFRRRFKGAFMITWKLLWPLRHRADRRNERKLRRDLAAACMPPPEDHRPHPVDDPAAVNAPLSYRRKVDDEID